MKLKGFMKNELLPAVVQEYETNDLLMLAYMNQESLSRTIKTGYMWFWSRSRRELWNKGKTSGNYQIVKEIWYDCDEDSLLFKVIQKGVGACHTQNKSCFYQKLL